MWSSRTAWAGVAAMSSAMAACDQLAATSEGKVWSIEKSANKDAPRLTMKTELSGVDTAGKVIPLELHLSGTGGSDWGSGGMRQLVEFKLISTSGAMLGEGPLLFVPEGKSRSPFGGGDVGSEVRQTPKGSVTCPTFIAHGAAASIRVLTGSEFIDTTAGDVKFRIDDERVRAMSELMRRIDATVPK